MMERFISHGKTRYCGLPAFRTLPFFPVPQQKQRALNKLWADVEAKRKALTAQQQVRGGGSCWGVHCTMYMSCSMASPQRANCCVTAACMVGGSTRPRNALEIKRGRIAAQLNACFACCSQTAASIPIINAGG